MKDESRYVELLEIFGEVRFGEGLDAVEGGLVSGQHPLEPERIAQALRDLRAWPVGAVERCAEILEELRAVVEDASADLVERLHRQAAGIGGRLQHQGRHRADQHGLSHALRAVAADIAGNFAAACGVADMDRVLQVERFNERREVVGVDVHLVAIPGLAGPSMAAAVMRDAAISAVGQKQHLVFPGVRAQGPAMAENYRLSLAPVLIVDLRAVFRPDRRHECSPLFLFPFKLYACLRSQMRAVYYTQEDRCGLFRVDRRDDNFVETRPSEQKNAMVKPYEAARCLRASWSLK